MSTFIKNWENHTVEKYKKSEPEPKDNAGPVFKAVRSTFDSIVLNNTDDVVVMFYAPLCEHCDKLESTFNKLAETLIENNKLKFVKVNGLRNDIEKNPLQAFPVIRLFSGENKVIYTYEGDRSEVDIANFIKDRSFNDIDINKIINKDIDKKVHDKDKVENSKDKDKKSNDEKSKPKIDL